VLSPSATQAPLFANQRGGAMTAYSMAHFLKELYAEAGITIPEASSHSGRRAHHAARGAPVLALLRVFCWQLLFSLLQTAPKRPYDTRIRNAQWRLVMAGACRETNSAIP
jgi:hypothetical protein